MGIDRRAVVDPSARTGNTVTIEAFAVIGPKMMIGCGSWVGAHAVVRGSAIIGCDNRAFQFASVGKDPRYSKYAGGVAQFETGIERHQQRGHMQT